MRILLLPFSSLFYLLVWLKNYFYNNFLNINKVKKPIICIGNLTTGGTGKTPWVQLVSHFFVGKNKKVVILSRGYTGDFDGVLSVTADMDPRRCGDEPLWLKKNSGADVYVGKKRFESAKLAIKEKNPDILILDDGFQHRIMKRDIDLVLLDASVQKKHYRMLPVGNLREPFSALKRSQIVIINKCNYGEPEMVQWLKEKALKFMDEEKIYFADFKFKQWQPVIEGLHKELPLQNISMSCGVGNPKAFLKTIAEQKIAPVKEFIFPDHYFWKPRDIEQMTYNMKRLESRDLVITEKDGVKLSRYRKHFQEMSIQLWVCKMKVALKFRESEFFEQLDHLLLEKTQQ